jgi:hypothetical protein
VRRTLVRCALIAIIVGALPAGAFAELQDRGLIVLLNAASGRQIARISANGVIDAAVADGHGGWFVGGGFTLLDNQRHIGLAHVLAGGSVDPAWLGSIGSASGRRGAVQALARTGARLYVAGAFARVSGLHRPCLGAIATDSGRGIGSWRPRPLLWLDIGALLATGRQLLVAGQFNYPTAGITALDARSGAVDRDWNPHLRLIGDAGSFNALLRHGSRVYVAGSFHVAGLERNGLVALNVNGGQPDRRWAPRPENCSVCIGFAVLYGLAASRSRVYVSGDFGRIDSLARDGLAALDSRTGAIVRQWQPGRDGGNILDLALSSERLYAGGNTASSLCRRVPVPLFTSPTSRHPDKSWRSRRPAPNYWSLAGHKRSTLGPRARLR